MLSLSSACAVSLPHASGPVQDVRYSATFGGLPALTGAYGVPVAAPFVLYILVQDDLPSALQVVSAPRLGLGASLLPSIRHARSFAIRADRASGRSGDRRRGDQHVCDL
jgi:hypothetical protein